VGVGAAVGAARRLFFFALCFCAFILLLLLGVRGWLVVGVRFIFGLELNFFKKFVVGCRGLLWRMVKQGSGCLLGKREGGKRRKGVGVSAGVRGQCVISVK
jgi:hypothetical protein